jgi:hypothetical protein
VIFDYEPGQFEDGQIVGVGLAGPYEVKSMAVAVEPDIGEAPSEVRVQRRVEHIGGNYHAIGGMIVGVEGGHRLRVSIVADWAERRGIGACTLHTPDVVAQRLTR